MTKLAGVLDVRHRRLPARTPSEPLTADHDGRTPDPVVESQPGPGNQAVQRLIRRGSVPIQAVARLQSTIGNQAVHRLIQTKLVVGPAGDRYEQEADRVADQVMARSPGAEGQSLQRADEDEMVQSKPLAATISRLVQRASAEDEEEPVQTKPLATPLQRAGPEEEELQTRRLDLQRTEEDEELHRSVSAPTSHAEAGFEVDPSLETRLASLQGQGSPLPTDVRSRMESRFGTDFSEVRVHAGSDAAHLSRQLSAQAFTHGSDVYFGEGRFDPSSPTGQRLLAHELTHVVQQTGARPLQPTRDDV